MSENLNDEGEGEEFEEPHVIREEEVSTHADFGGPGTVAAWNYAKAHSTVDPATDPQLAAEFGPNAPRVKGGT